MIYVGSAVVLGLAMFFTSPRVLSWAVLLPRVTRRVRVYQPQCIEMRTVGRIEHELLVNGEVVTRDEDEAAVRTLKAALEEVR